MSTKHKKDSLQEQLQEIFALEPNDLSLPPLTRMYKITTGRLKTMPFLYVVPLAFIFAIVLYILFGQLVIKLVSLLQYGS